jgi:predicted RNase H-like nuclease (RuvC/YqgF family)
MTQVTNPQPPSDDLAGAITNAMRGVHELREENATLRRRNDDLEHRRSVLESEITSLKAQLDNERNERRHYHSLANEIITRLDVVGRTVDDVVQSARHEAQRQRRDCPRGDVPELKIPQFLKQPTSANVQAEPKADAPGRTNIRPIQAPKPAAPERVAS